MSFLEDPVITGILKTSLAASVSVHNIFQSGKFSVDRKSDRSHLTGADLLSNRICHKGLMATLPDAGWLSEESADDESRLKKESVWIVDPIDGTREFVQGVEEYSISIGLSKNGYPEYGSISIPSKERIILGSEKSGVFLFTYKTKEIQSHFQDMQFDENLDENVLLSKINAEWNEILQCLSFEKKALSGVSDLNKARIFVSKTEYERGKFQEIEKDFQILPSGSVARKLGLISIGEGDLSVSLNHKNDWDICGGTSLVLASGGEVIDLTELNRRNFNQRDPLSYGLLAGSPSLVKNFAEYLKNKKIIA